MVPVSLDHASEVLSFDERHVWHPYAGTTSSSARWVVTGADGVRIRLEDDKTRTEVIDAMASWWCMIHGYRHPALDEAAHRQLDSFSHVMFGGLTHAPAAALTQRLVRLAPKGLDRVFLADSGSVAMEVALKLARQVHIARAARVPGSKVRNRFAALTGGYHGDTWGAMSVCDPSGGMHSMYAGSVEAQVFLQRPPAFDAPAEVVAAWVEQARAQVRAARDDLAAIVVEPILQGAGGMWPWAPGALAALRDVADEFDLLLVADEIATGFGRTGRLFACDWSGITPDILVVGKAMTGGYLTQAAVLTSDALAAEISRGPGGALMHGPTFMANPLACAVSCASLDLISSGSWRDDVARQQRVLSRELAPLRGHEAVSDVRVLGASAAIELHRGVDAKAATEAAVRHGVWLRPFRNLIYAMPPYITGEEDLNTIAVAMAAAVEAGAS